MAKTPVTLKVKDFEDREVMHVQYKFTQATDIEGQVVGLARGGRISIKVKAMNDGNNQLIQWMLAPNDPRDIEIVYENTKDGATMKTIKGKACSCVDYIERWEEGIGHYEIIEVVCQVLDDGGVIFENEWR